MVGERGSQADQAETAARSACFGWSLAAGAAWAGVPTVDFPTKIAPASMDSVLALMSPTTSALAFSSTRSVTVMLPWTLP